MCCFFLNLKIPTKRAELSSCLRFLKEVKSEVTFIPFAVRLLLSELFLKQLPVLQTGDCGESLSVTDKEFIDMHAKLQSGYRVSVTVDEREKMISFIIDTTLLQDKYLDGLCVMDSGSDDAGTNTWPPNIECFEDLVGSCSNAEFRLDIAEYLKSIVDPITSSCSVECKATIHGQRKGHEGRLPIVIYVERPHLMKEVQKKIINESKRLAGVVGCLLPCHCVEVSSNLSERTLV